jgi:hypothetical protein
MYSLSKAFFFSLGTILFLVLSLFWIGLALDFSALENFIVNLSYSKYVGYTIPQIIGAGCEDTVVEQVFRLKIICTLIGISYGSVMLWISNLKTKKAKLLWLYYSIVIPLILVLALIWFKIIYDDHILSYADKIELSQFTTFGFIVSIILILLSVRKEKSKLAKSVAAKLPTVDELKTEIIDSSSGKSTNAVDPKIDKEGSNDDNASSIITDKNAEIKPVEEKKATVSKEAEEINSKVDAEAGPVDEGSEIKKEQKTDDDLAPPALDELPPELAELREQSVPKEETELSDKDEEIEKPEEEK